MPIHLSIGHINTPPGQHRHVRVETPQLVIGRHRDCDLTVSHPSLSRQHCRIFLQDGQYLVEDLGSSPGTLLNEHTLRQPTPLKQHARVRCGEVLIVVHNLSSDSSHGDGGHSSSSKRRVTRPQTSAGQDDAAVDSTLDSPLDSTKARRAAILPRKNTNLLAVAAQLDITPSDDNAKPKRRMIRPRGKDDDSDIHPARPSTVEMMVGDLNYHSEDLAHASDFFDLSDTD